MLRFWIDDFSKMSAATNQSYDFFGKTGKFSFFAIGCDLLFVIIFFRYENCSLSFTIGSLDPNFHFHDLLIFDLRFFAELHVAEEALRLEKGHLGL